MSTPSPAHPVTTALPTVAARELPEETLLVLVVNSGSSSLKYQVRELTRDGRDTADPVVTKGLVERIGASGGAITHEVDGDAHEREVDAPDHEAAMAAMAEAFALRPPEPSATRMRPAATPPKPGMSAKQMWPIMMMIAE